MKRRDFFGNVLGLFVSTQLPFKAYQADYNKSTKLEQAQNMIRLFEIDQNKLYACKLAVKTVNGEVFLSPMIEEVKIDRVNLHLELKAQDVKLTKSVTVKGLLLLDDRSRLVEEKDLLAIMPFVPGDVLRVTYDLSIGF